MFRVEISTENAAFHNNNRDDRGTYEPGPELARILRRIADSVEDGWHLQGQCRDVNGNRVGHWADNRDDD